MKKRNIGFLSNELINHNSEQFDYIQELHEYLWKFIRSQIPNASGKLDKYLDVALEIAENKSKN